MSAKLIQTGPDLPKTTRALLEAANPAAAAAIDKHIRPVYDDAVRGWPVKTGRSKRELRWVEQLVGGDQVRVSIRCDAPYAFYIRRPGGGKQVFRQLIVEPAERAKDRIVAEFGDELARVAGRK